MTPQIERFQIGLILLLSSTVLMVFAKVNLFPNQKTIVTFTLPTTVALSDWQSQKSEPITENYPKFQSGRKYQYQKNQVTIEAEMRHLVNTDGDVKQYLQHYRSMSFTQSPVIKHQKGVGFYGLVTESDRTYLSACINPRGEGTFTGIQFGRNRNTHDLQVDRLFPWLLGGAELRDNRCLWVVLSIATEKNIEQNYRVLETAWLSLYPDLQALFSQK